MSPMTPTLVLQVPPSIIGAKINVGDDLVISSRVGSKKPSTLQYQWATESVVSGPITLNPSLVSGLTSGKLKIMGGALSAGSTYKLTLSVTDQYGSVASSALVIVNSPPTGGVVDVLPLTGLAFATKFLMKASSWADEDLPLLYKFSFWKNQTDVGNMDKLNDATQWSSDLTKNKVLPNPENTDNNIYLYSLAKDSYGGIGVSSNGITLFVTPLKFLKIDDVVNLHTSLFQQTILNDPGDVLTSSGLVTNALNSYVKSTRLRFLVQSAEDTQKEQDISGDLIRKIGNVGINELSTFENSASIIGSLLESPTRLTSSSASDLVNYMGTQLNSYTETGMLMTSSGRDNTANIIDSILSSQTVTTSTGQRILAEGLASSIGKVATGMFQSISASQGTGETTKIDKNNFGMMVSTLSPTSLQKSVISIDSTSSKQPSMTLPSDFMAG